MQPVEQTVFLDGKNVTFIWMNGEKLEDYSPIKQCYGVIINKNNEILVGRGKGSTRWTIPGGTPEEGETYLEALKRELIEEVDVEVIEAKVLGVQKAFEVGREKDAIYQARYVVTKFNLLPQTPDPDGGSQWERKFVPAQEINEYVKWGKTGKAMFADAIRLKNS